MNLEEAKAVMVACNEINANLNNVSTVVDAIKDDALKKALRTELGSAMVKVYGLMRPIIHDFPELDPDPDS